MSSIGQNVDDFLFVYFVSHFYGSAESDTIRCLQRIWDDKDFTNGSKDLTW